MAIRRLTFTSKYKTIYLVYYDTYRYINHDIEREKELKGKTRQKKEELINAVIRVGNF